MECYHVCPDTLHTGDRNWHHTCSAGAGIDPWKLRCPECFTNKIERDTYHDTRRSGAPDRIEAGTDSWRDGADGPGWSDSDRYEVFAEDETEVGRLGRSLSMASTASDEVTELQILHQNQNKGEKNKMLRHVLNDKEYINAQFQDRTPPAQKQSEADCIRENTDRDIEKLKRMPKIDANNPTLAEDETLLALTSHVRRPGETFYALIARVGISPGHVREWTGDRIAEFCRLSEEREKDEIHISGHFESLSASE